MKLLVGTAKGGSKWTNSHFGIAGSDVGIDGSKVGTLRAETRSANSELGIRKSEKQFVRTGSGPLNSENGIRKFFEGVSRSEEVSSERKTDHGEFKEEVTPHSSITSRGESHG